MHDIQSDALSDEMFSEKSKAASKSKTLASESDSEKLRGAKASSSNVQQASQTQTQTPTSAAVPNVEAAHAESAAKQQAIVRLSEKMQREQQTVQPAVSVCV